MKCNQCGYESEENFSFCPGCGRSGQAAAPACSSAVSTILPALKDSLFLVLCVLLSASCLLSLLNGDLPLLNVLATIFLWLTFAKSRKGIADAGHIRQLSGTVFASYVITYVLAGLVLLAGAICTVALGVLADMPEIWNEVLAELDIMDEGYLEMSELIAELSGAIASISGTVIFVVFIIIAACIAVINAFSVRYIHGFVKSCYQSLRSGGLNLKYANAAANWMIVFAVFTGLSALGSLSPITLLPALTEGSMCSFYIVAAILLKKHFRAS